MNTPERITKKSSPPVDPEVKVTVKEILQELEYRRQLLGKKIPLSQLERPYKFTLK